MGNGYFKNGWTARSYTKKNLEQRYESILKRYKISRAYLDRMIKDQSNKCALCFQVFKDGLFVVDHCHESGNVRGLLCRNCNDGLGKLGDNFSGIARALFYLTR